MCLWVAWSVSVCYHLPCKCLPLSFHVRTCSPSTMLFLNVMVVSMCLVFFASLNDNGSARCFTSRHTSPDLVWECWHLTAESEVRLARGVDLRSVPSWCALLSTCSCVSIRVCIQFSRIIDLIEDNRGNARDCAHPHGGCVRSYMCVCGKVFFESYFSCQQAYVKSLTVSNGLVNCRALKCM